MPYRPRNINKQWVDFLGRPVRVQQQSGWYANGVEVTPYSGRYWSVYPHVWKGPNGNYHTEPQRSLIDGAKARSVNASNRAYAKFKDKAVGEQSSVGVAAAEWRKSFDMVSNRLMQMYKAFRAAKRGDIEGFTDALGVMPKRKHRHVPAAQLARKASSIVLEYNFGWVPMVMDVTQSFTVLSQPLPGGRAKGVSGSSLYWRVWQYNGPGGQDYRDYYCTIIYAQYAEVYLTNPNLFLANQLGLTNVGTIAWELIPFSFLADWAFSVQNFLESFTDFMGCSVLNPGSTVFVKGICEQTMKDRYDPRWNQFYIHDIVESSRVPSLTKPVPSTQVRANLGDSKRRAVNAASLLTQLVTRY